MARTAPVRRARESGSPSERAWRTRGHCVKETGVARATVAGRRSLSTHASTHTRTCDFREGATSERVHNPTLTPTQAIRIAAEFSVHLLRNRRVRSQERETDRPLVFFRTFSNKKPRGVYRGERYIRTHSLQ
jgi:hypothetical protein